MPEQDWFPETTRFQPALKGTLFADRPFQLHPAIIAVLGEAAQVQQAMSGASASQLAETERLLKRPRAFCDSLYKPLGTLLVEEKGEWRRAGDHSAEAERLTTPLVARAFNLAWPGQEPEATEIRRVLNLIRDGEATDEDRASGQRAIRTLAGDYKSPRWTEFAMREVKICLALVSAISYPEDCASSAAVGDAAAALLYAEKEQEARELVLDFCRVFYVFEQPLPAVVGDGPRGRLSNLAEIG